MNKYLTAYQHLVAEKYQAYNKRFLELPYPGIPEAGQSLARFSEHCKHAIEQQHTPDQIIEAYFSNDTLEERFSTLFIFLQFIERQVVLFDALEECAFALTHDTHSEGSLAHHLDARHTTERPVGYQTRIVLTAHPTQFYAPYVLQIIQDLSFAIQSENHADIQKLLLQMSQTPFMAKQQPTPLDEATFLMRYLTDVFYPTLSEIQLTTSEHIHSSLPAIQLGFWPGGDRDGNPNVDANTTLNVARLLKKNLLSCYRQDLHRIQRRLTFDGIIEQLNAVVANLENYPNPEALIDELSTLRTQVIEQHEGLFVERVEQLIASIQCFGFYFASLDIRQDSRCHEQFIDTYLPGYAAKSPSEKCATLNQRLDDATPIVDTQQDVIAALQTIPVIQHENGPSGCHRYIVSNTQGAHHILEILLLAKWAGIDAACLDLVPLFESIPDLQQATSIMAELYANPHYQAHLIKRHHQQTIMLGFSDGTKDGGYVTANWSIYQAKKQLSQQANEHDIEVIFFDGRGGPPARGGGNTHRFYRAQEPDISLKQIQLTIQGQTISSNFGTPIAAQYNLEQLYTAGLIQQRPRLTDPQQQLLDSLSNTAYQKYQSLKHHPAFLPYLEHATPLTLYGELNIASRPPKRNNTGDLNLSDLRAIPFVGAWSQMKQNIPGFYGLGTALKSLCDQDKLDALQTLYDESGYFSTLLDNAAQSLEKTVFVLTEYLSQHKEYGELWHDLQDEAELTQDMILLISKQQQLLESDPITRYSIELREAIVLPLQVIQQYALMNLQRPNAHHETLHKLLLKSMATNINAARNSA